MRRLFRISLVVLVLGVVSFAGLALHAKGSPWQACPQPPCLAPCSSEPAPEVLCKTKRGKPFVTSFACCCCGSSADTAFQRL